eukprot:TRINITY_DN3991_c3_g2_i1.p1 TRINITY_DN3991_c3_g2~~TRINITY_DN3991_c3_g2_i1.p1  ORF type:complete len:222 (+),score=28.92 TRINITY_DN3991_c3_g2_i1:143-808(+)
MKRSAVVQSMLSAGMSHGARRVWLGVGARAGQPPVTRVQANVAGSEPLVAVDGDLVTLHYVCSDKDGQVIDSSREREEPITLEVGVGEVVGNPLAQALEQAVRSHGVGDEVELEITGGDYKQELVFKVPTDHPEIARLQGRYKSQGGLQKDKVYELANGGLARVLEIDDETVVLDANNMLAGLERFISIEVLGIERPNQRVHACKRAPSPVLAVCGSVISQ